MSGIVPPIINLDDLRPERQAHGDRFESLTAPIAAPLGATRLGARLVIVPPGKRAWPYHGHHANEEMFLILEGGGRLRYSGGEYALRPLDVVVCPARGADSAHQIINTGDDDLRYLAISTMNQPELIDYPDSGKFAIMVGAPPGGNKSSRTVDHVGRYVDAVGYWDDET